MPVCCCPRCAANQVVLELSQEWLKVTCPECNYEFFLPSDYPANDFSVPAIGNQKS